jgi:hypothetical protein
MKDARGHGSNPRGGSSSDGYFHPTMAAAHQAGVEKIMRRFNAGGHVGIGKFGAAMDAIAFQNWKQNWEKEGNRS